MTSTTSGTEKEMSEDFQEWKESSLGTSGRIVECELVRRKFSIHTVPPRARMRTHACAVE